MVEKDLLADAWALIEEYLEGNGDPGTPVIEYLAVPSLRSRLDLSLGEEGVGAEELPGFLRSYLRYSLRSGHPQFHNQLWAGFDTAGFLGDVFSSLANTSMYTYEVSPVATLMELELIRKMNGFVGFADGDGIFCSGGSNANLIGMLCARHRRFPRAKARGFGSDEKPVVLVSEQSHYSFARAADFLGIGLDNVILVKTDGEGRMMPAELEREIARSLGRGEHPLMVGATSGTTVRGTFDPLPEIVEICRRHELWLHVDGSWGGPVLLSARHRHLLAGSGDADSFTWDAHKMMGAPLACTAFLTRHRGILPQVCATSVDDPEYLFHPNDDSSYDLGKKSPQCGRRVDALKLWLMWKRYGDAGLAARIDRLFELAEFATAEVERRPELELLAPTRSLNVCFRHIAAGGGDGVDALNVEIRERLRKSGRTLVNYSTLDGRVALRLVFADPLVTPADVTRFFDLVAEAATEIREASPAVSA